MTHRRIAAVGCLLGLAAVGLSGAGARQASGPPAPTGAVAPQAMLMYWVDRSYNQMKLASVQKKGERGEQYAWLLAELSNVNKAHSDNAKFLELADAASKLSVEAAGAFKEGKFDQAKELAKQIDSKCDACHHEFRKDDDGDG